jgi:hypothetical protein
LETIVGLFTGTVDRQVTNGGAPTLILWSTTAGASHSSGERTIDRQGSVVGLVIALLVSLMVLSGYSTF